MSASGEDHISTFERHCGLLLRSYPEAYRSERGEEIIGTLLETTPEGRAWPLPRDIRSLVTGGLSARAALSRRNTTAANLRVAAFVGVAAYLANQAAGSLGEVVSAAEHGMPFAWPTLVVVTLIAVTLVLAWLSRRRVIVLACALPAVAALAVVGPWQLSNAGFGFTSSATELACMAVLVALAGRERPGRRWLWLIGPNVLAQLLMAGVLPGIRMDAMETMDLVIECLVLTLLVVGIAWLAFDARLAIAIVVQALAGWLPLAIVNLAFPSIYPRLPLVSICAVGIYAAVAVPAVWLLRRQSAHPGRPTRI